MTFSRKLLLAAPLAVGLVAGLPEWISSIEVRHKLEDVFYRTVTLGANTFAWRKPPRETRPLLTQQIQQAPAEAQLYYLRAREAEAQLDFPAAEADWAKYVQIAPARAAAWREKADFHQRRSEPEKELAALLEAAKLPATGPEIYRPVRAQQAWLALERAAKLIPDHLLSDDRALDVFRAREARYPNEPETYTRFSAWLADRKRWNDLEALIGRYEGRFPADETWPLLTRASIERGRNGVNAAIALYDRAFRPDWSDAPLKNYFQLLDEAGARRGFVATARQRHTADPAAADPAARLFHHFRLAGDTPAAQRVLHDWSRARNGRWTPAEQATLAGFHAAVQDFEQAARAWHAAYLSNDPAVSERSLAALIDLLITQAAQPFRFGGGDLSFYRDIAQLDANPGFWNGIVSLVLNGTQPAAELSQQERKATPYFHRAAAAELLDAFDRRFPQSARRSALHAQVIEASALHAESDRVVRLGTAYLAAFPDAPERTRVALATADAHARLSQTQAEFALYDSLLNELAARAGRVPIGETPSSARNVEYPRVLDRYIARLVAMRQPAQALALYRREIDRNPNDPGLYERLAAFLEQNKMTGEIEATYRRAIQQFPDKSWSHKLARFFLRQKMNAQFDAFTRDVAAAFSGTELEQYLTATAQQGALDPVLYRQVNLYAYRRFPHHLPFVRNLLNAYTNRATADPAEWERLLRAHWIYDETLRARFFSHLSSSGKLDAELAALRSQTPNNAPAALWVGEAEAWKSHFEAAAPLLKAVAADYPADRDLVSRAAALHRSLNQIPAAMQLEETLAQAHPTDAAILTRLGEMQAEQERYDRAAAYWNRIIAAAPGRAATHLEVATLHWDYYRYDEARARIAEARRRLNDPHLFAYEAGAICENEANLACAAREYVSGGDAAQRRLIKVATRPAWRQPIESALAAAGNNAATLALRVSLLESQSRKADIETLLTQAIPNAGPEWLAEIRTHAQRSGLVNVERRVLDRQYALADHPAAKMAALAERIRFEESANAPAAATAAADTLLRDYPRSVGAIRTAVNFFWRSGQKSRAPAALLAAAPNAYKTLQRQFRLEAIRKLTETGDYAAAHREAAVLLAADPADEQAIALKADAFARAGDDRGLAALYRDLLARPLATVRAATLRRAWIPALIRLNDTTGAADQYIELLKQFSEDEALQREAARFAAASGQRARVTGYFAKAESDSPRDPRWPIVRARLEHEFGDFNAALAAWGRAVALRPERVDILSGRALLEERLGQFDKATASYRKLYDISFHNPTWLESGARVLARQGKNDECVRWLREAFVDNRPANANGAIQVAQRLLEWGLAEPARAELARAPLTVEGAPILARAHATLRQLDSIPPAFNVQAIQSAAAVAGRLYTPEEKVRFGVWLESRRNGVPPEALASAALTAGLADIAARIYARNLPDHLDSLIRLQSQRQQFGELGRQLEAFARAQSNTDEKPNLLRRARSAYFAAGDDASELRVLQAIGEFDDRYFELLTRGGTVPQNRNDNFLDQLANYALRAGKAPVALQAIANRRGPLWQNAQRAAAGLYFGENSPAVRKAFIDILGPERIGEKLALAGNRDATLAGDVWFSYAGRYGAWLQLAQDTNSPHYLAALVERRSNSAAAYLALGEESYGATAEQAFRTALVLDEHQPIALSRLASLALARGDKPAATALWRQAVDELRWWQDNRRVQEWFWSEAARIFRESAAAGLRAELRDPIDSLLRAYVKRNGAYRVRDLLEGSLDATEIGTLARSAADPAGFLAQLNNESWLPESGRDALLKLQLDFAIDKLSRATGDERALARDFVENARIRYAGFLLRANRAATARPILDALIANPEVRQRYDVAELRLLLAVAEKRVASLLPDLPAEPEFLRNLGNTLRRLNYAAEARQVLAASYELDLKNGNVDAAIPGLAALHIEAGAPEKAPPLFDVFVMQSAVPFARHLTAGELFLRSNRKAEAVRYLEPLAVAEPWNREARALLAEARDDDAALATLAADANAPYASRLRAAQWLGANKPRPIQSGAGELDLLATNTAAAPAAEQPLWVAARRAAVAIARDNATKIRLYRGILAIAPTDDDSAVKLFRTLLAAGRPREASSSIEERQYALNELEDRARLADAQARAGDLPRALNTFEMLFNMAPPEQTRRYEPAHAALRAQAERNARNEARRPVVDKELEQRNIVKPRLLAPGGAR